MMSSLLNQVIPGIFWRFANLFGTQIVSFAVLIVLAQLLGTEGFCTVALLTLFWALSSRLVNSGFGSALIHMRNVDHLDLRSVFYLKFAIKNIICGVLPGGALCCAMFFRSPALMTVLWMLAHRLIFDGLCDVKTAYPFLQSLDNPNCVKNSGRFPLTVQCSRRSCFMYSLTGLVHNVQAHCSLSLFLGDGLFPRLISLLTASLFIGLELIMGDRVQVLGGVK